MSSSFESSSNLSIFRLCTKVESIRHPNVCSDRREGEGEITYDDQREILQLPNARDGLGQLRQLFWGPIFVDNDVQQGVPGADPDLLLLFGILQVQLDVLTLRNWGFVPFL